MQTRLGPSVVGAICAAAAITIAGSASASTAPHPYYDFKAHWRLVFKTSAGDRNGFIAIAASGPRSAWAVGQRGDATYLLRWNGKTWRRMALPADYSPSGVAGSSPSDIYVFGFLTPPGSWSSGEVLHWNGHAWSRASRAVAVTIIDISPSDVWDESQSGYLDHWNGKTWSRSTSQYAKSAYPGTIAAVGRQAWRTETGTVGRQRHRLIVQRWTGTAWREVSSPHPYVHGRFYPELTASSAGNAWIELPSPGPGLHAVRLLHWNGKVWTELVWPWDLSPLAVGHLAAMGRASVWLGNGALLRNRGGWHQSNDGGCGIPVGVPGSNSALCAGAASTSRDRGYGTISRSGPLP